MLKKILILIALFIIGFIGAALLKSPDFRVERSITVAVPPEAVFVWFNSHRKFNEFNPWLKMDPGAKVEYLGPETGFGSASTWEGGKTGKGRATIIESGRTSSSACAWTGWSRWRASAPWIISSSPTAAKPPSPGPCTAGTKASSPG
jgi:hypothetical protein